MDLLVLAAKDFGLKRGTTIFLYTIQFHGFSGNKEGKIRIIFTLMLCLGKKMKLRSLNTFIGIFTALSQIQETIFPSQ